jgi:DNA uptake protein ComE-like DNA-binding protein
MVLTVLTAAAIALSATARLEVRAARRGVDQVQREAALRGAVNRGIALLEEGRTDPEALLSALRNNQELRWTRFTPDANADQPQLQIAVQLLDTSARLNINTADSSQLQKLPGMDEDAAGSIVSWRNEKSRDRYDRGPRPYEPKRRPFDTVEELLLVHDVTPAQFFGSPNIQEMKERRTAPLSEWLTAWSGENNADAEGNPRVDVNSGSSEELLEAANRQRQCVTAEQVQTLLQKREERKNGGTADQASQGQQQPKEFQSVSEALREAGVEEAKWGPVLDAWTADRRNFLPGRINVNTASPAVLATLTGMNAELANKLVQKRESKRAGLDWTDLLDLLANTGPESGGGNPPPDGPPQQQQQQQQQPQQQQQQGQGTDQLERLFCLRSSIYLVRCLVREVGSHRTDAVMALIHWPVSPDDPAEVIQWRQPDRFPGWSAWYRPVAEDERGRGG